MLSGKIGFKGAPLLSKAFHDVCLVYLWLIWKWRNTFFHARVEDRNRIITEDVFPSVQRTFLPWISNRCQKVGVDWAKWISCPSECFLG